MNKALCALAPMPKLGGMESFLDDGNESKANHLISRISNFAIGLNLVFIGTPGIKKSLHSWSLIVFVINIVGSILSAIS